MVSWLPHLIIPILPALAFFPMARRQILWMAPVVWVADVDYIFPAEHRALTHSFLIPLTVAAALVIMWRRNDPTARFLEYATRPGHPGNLLLASYYLASHLLLDVFQGGVVLFWPLLDINFYWHFELILNTATNTFTPEGEVGTSEGAPPLSPLYPWISSVDTATLAFLALFGVGWGLARAWHRRTGPPPPIVVVRTAKLEDPIHKA